MSTNIILTISAWACIFFYKKSILENRDWLLFFIIFGCATLSGGIGHYYQNHYTILQFSRSLTVISMFFAFRGSIKLYGLNSPNILSIINAVSQFCLVLLLVLYNKFFFVIISSAITFGIVIPWGIYKVRKQFLPAPRDMLIGVLLQLTSGIVFALKLGGSVENTNHLAHVPGILGIIFIGKSISKHVQLLNSK